MLDGATVKVIIPALNEAASVGRVVAAVPRWADEVLVVDNGSTDGTGRRAAEAGARVVVEPWRGYGQACLAGLAAAGDCDVVVFLDADLSDDPRQMRRLVEPVVRDEADLVIGSRVLGAAEPGSLTALQRFGNALACGLMRLLWRGTFTDLGPFRAVRLSALRSLGMRDTNYGWTIEMQIKALRAGLRVAEVPVDYRRRVGVSKISGTFRGAVGAGCKILATVARHAFAGRPVGGEPRRLIVLTRYPRPGRAKTRLIPALGPVGAAALQRRMAEQVVRTAREAAGGAMQLEVRYADGSAGQMRRWLGAGPACRPQGPGDLGERLRRAFREASDAGCRRVVAVGTDCPSLTAGDIRAAFDALVGADVVFGPSTDGGYWLVGLRRPVELFDGIDWGTPAVLAQSLSAAARAGASVALLAEKADVDRPADLKVLPRPPRRGPWLSVVIPALNEESSVAAAVASARACGAEVLVVDGRSGDATADRARRAGAEVLVCSPGRARQMNLGAARAAGEVLLFLHADTLLPAGWMEMVFEALADRRVVGGAFEHATDAGGAAMDLLRRAVNFRSRRLGLPYGDQALFARREAFEAAGGFPDVPVAEDLHFVRRLGRLGRLAVLPAPAVTSARRWQERGLVRTTLRNQLILAAVLLGILPDLPARRLSAAPRAPLTAGGPRVR